jgi:hypothetical protein
MTDCLRIRNPRTGVYDYTLETTPKDSVKDIARILRANQAAWQAMGYEKRLEILAAWNVEVQKDKDVILEALIADTGRLVESQREMLRLPSSIEKLAVLGKEVFKERSHRLSSMPHVEIQGGLSPYPLVGVISPWNFPLSSSLLDTIPALVAGCAAIVKPSEFTPRFVKPFLETLARVPEMHAVLRYVVGPGDLGAELVSQVDAVCISFPLFWSWGGKTRPSLPQTPISIKPALRLRKALCQMQAKSAFRLNGCMSMKKSPTHLLKNFRRKSRVSNWPIPAFMTEILALLFKRPKLL